MAQENYRYGEERGIADMDWSKWTREEFAAYIIRQHQNPRTPLSFHWMQDRDELKEAYRRDHAGADPPGALQLDRRVAEAVFFLYRRGLIMPNFGSSSATGPFGYVLLTEEGRIAEVDSSLVLALGPSAYEQRIRRLVPAVDSVILRYADEALHAFDNEIDLGAAFLLGAAAEQASQLLVDAVVPYVRSPREKSTLQGRSIKAKIETLGMIIQRTVGQSRATWKANGQITEAQERSLDELQGILYTLQTAIRLARNEVGHPAIPSVLDRNELRAHLQVFPRFVMMVYDILAALRLGP